MRPFSPKGRLLRVVKYTTVRYAEFLMVENGKKTFSHKSGHVQCHRSNVQFQNMLKAKDSDVPRRVAGGPRSSDI